MLTRPKRQKCTRHSPTHRHAMVERAGSRIYLRRINKRFIDMDDSMRDAGKD